MNTPKFTPSVPPVAPQIPVAEEGTVARLTAQVDQLSTICEQQDKILAQAKAILKDLVAAGVLTDGFMTNAVGHSLLNQAAAAKKFLEAHP